MLYSSLIHYFSAQFDVSSAVNSTSFYTTKFQYGHGLVHSSNKADIPLGISLLKQLLGEHKGDVHAQRDYGKIPVFYLILKSYLNVVAYFVAIGHYRLNEFDACITKSRQILKLEPTNHQCRGLSIQNYVILQYRLNL